MSTISEEDDSLAVDWFQEPAGYEAPEKPHTFESVKLGAGNEYSIRLVGSNPLWVIQYILEHTFPGLI